MTMRKKILGIAFVAMTIFAANSFAQTPVANDNSIKVENVKGKKTDKQQNKRNPYEGLTLTDVQKTQLQQLDEKRAAQRKENAEAKKAEKQQKNADRMAARKAAKMEYLQEVKGIVGPEQYVVFLENFYVNGNSQGAKNKMQSSRKGGKNSAHVKNMKGRKGENGKGSKVRGDKQATRVIAGKQTAQL